MCRYKNVGVAGYAEAFIPVQSDSQTSEWYSYFENDVLVFRLLQVTPIQIGIALNWNLIITLKGRPAMV